jgi:diguanylate cyclase (GGDEF)-like protein
LPRLVTAERCRSAVEQRTWEAEGLGAFTVTVSVGVSSAKAPTDGAAVLTEADEAVYMSKDAGRNRVTAHT